MNRVPHHERESPIKNAETERRDRFFAQVRNDLLRLRANPEEWNDYVAEFASMDGTLMDGLEDLPWEE
jgi:hypothetical protein